MAVEEGRVANATCRRRRQLPLGPPRVSMKSTMLRPPRVLPHRWPLLALAVMVGSVGLAAPAGAEEDPLKAQESFKSPPSAFRPRVLWSWNAALEDDELRRQIRGFRDQGFGGFLIHPGAGLKTT